MELLRRISSFGVPTKDLIDVYILFVRSILEQSATVWHSGLTSENSNDIERVQKSASKIMLKDKYKGYKKCLGKAGTRYLTKKKETIMPQFC